MHERRLLFILSLPTCEPGLVCVRAVPCQEQLCLFGAGIVRKPGVTLGCWTELPVDQQVGLNAKSFLELGNVSSPWPVLHCWLQHVRGSGEGWAGIFLGVESFCHRHNCVFSCPARRKDCLPWVITCFIAWGREKARAILSFPSEFLSHKAEPELHPNRQIPPSEICMK